ncbi:MAG TPA: hypothetical protein VFZ53_05220 [Polyangiaceae bacterium]
MTTLREITVQWKVEVDDSALKGAAKKIAALNAQLRRLDKTALNALGTGGAGTGAGAAGRPARARREIDATTKAFEKQLKVKKKIAKVEKQSLMEARKTGVWRRVAPERQASLMEARKTGVFRRASPAAERQQSLMEARRTGVFRRAAPVAAAAQRRRMPESGMLNAGFDIAARGSAFGDAQRERAEREAARIRANAARVEARESANRARQSGAMRRRAQRRSQESRSAVADFGLATLAAAAGVGYAGWNAVQRGSDARETDSLLGVVYGQGTDSVRGTADQTAAAMGRSKYAMRKSVGAFGAFLTPQLRGTGADIGGMSQQLSQLAPDLASLYNVKTDKEAQDRLFSGIAGETEAVRKVGIDLSDASLEALAKSKGIPKAYNQLTQPEKTMLRFEKVLMDSTLAQGDAVRTAHELANIQRALHAQWDEMTTELGESLVPRVKEWALLMKSDGIPIMKRFVVQTRGLESAFEYLGVAAMGVAGAFIAASPALAAGLGALGASLLAFDDIRATQEGKPSVLGDFAKGLVPGTDPAFGMDRLGSVFAGAPDIAFAALKDLTTGNLFTPGRTQAAIGRFSQSWNGAQDAKQQRLDKRYRLAAAGDTAAFGASGGTTEEYLSLRRTAVGRGEILPTAQDVADGIVPAQTVGAPSPAQALASNMAGVQVRVNVDKAFATPEQLSEAVAEAMAIALGQTKASVGEEFSTQNYGEDD